MNRLRNILFCYRLLMLGVVMSLCACASIPDQNVDLAKNNLTSFKKDLKECKEDYPESGSGVHVRQWEGCMNLKGWK